MSEGLRVHVRGPRPTPRRLARELADVAAALPLFAAAPALRRWHRRWGATDAEVAARMPGDDLVPGSQYVATRALTIDAPPEAVWPWLVQVGFGRAGFYSHDLLDNLGHPSADRVVEELQHVRVGDRVPMFSKVSDTTAAPAGGGAPLAPPERARRLPDDAEVAADVEGEGGGGAAGVVPAAAERARRLHEALASR